MNIKFQAEGTHAVELKRETMSTASLKTNIPVNSIGGRAHETFADMKITGKIRSSSETAEADNTIKLAQWAADIHDQNAYQKVSVTTEGAGNVVNKTVFPFAFFVKYEEEYDTRSGVGSFTGVLREKKEKLDNIEVNGGYAAE